MKILFLSNLVPYPLDSGGKIKTFTSIVALSENHILDLICFYENEDIEKAKGTLSKHCRMLELIPIKVTTALNKKLMYRKAMESLFSEAPFCVYKYRSRYMKNKISELVRKEKYDIVYINYLQMYEYKYIIEKIDPNLKFVLDTQNCETLIFERYAREEKKYLQRCFLKLECNKLRKFEADSVRDVNKLIVLSKEDKSGLEQLAEQKLEASIIPIGVQKPKIVRQIECSKKHMHILFVGTLSWAPNNEGMIWFMKKVVPILSESFDFHMDIVGKNPSDDLKMYVNKYKNIELTGYAESIEPYYKKCDFLVVPLFIGSGQRVKIIEAFSYGMPVISTTIGAEGLEYKKNYDILIADTEEEFVKQIKEMHDVTLRRQLSERGRRIFEKYYSTEAVSKLINNVVADLC